MAACSGSVFTTTFHLIVISPIIKYFPLVSERLNGANISLLWALLQNRMPGVQVLRPCQTSCGASREKAPQILDSKDLRGFLFFPVRKMIFCFFLKNPLITLLLQSMQRINRL